MSSSPRVTNVNTIPTTDNSGNVIFLPAPPANFPVTYPTGTFSIGTHDRPEPQNPRIPTPWIFLFPPVEGWIRAGGGVRGAIGRRLLTQLDSATALDFRDKGAGIDYYTAVTALAKLYRTAQQGTESE